MRAPDEHLTAEQGAAERMLQLARRVTGRHDLDDVLVEVFRGLRPLVQFSGGSIQLLDDDGWIHMAASDPIAPDHVMAARVSLGSSVAGRVILTEQPIYLPDIHGQDESSDDTTPGRRVSTGVRSYLGVPLVADGRAIGVLQVDSDRAEAWSADDRETLLAAASIVASAIQNARAYERAAAAQVRVRELEARLRDAAELVALARDALREGEHDQLERHLAGIQTMLDPGRSLPRQVDLTGDRPLRSVTPPT